MRPWLHTDAQNLEVHYPAVEPHPALNPVVQVLDRKRCGGRPRRITSLLDIPAQYVVVLKDGSSHYVPGSRLREPHERELVKKFELRFQRVALQPSQGLFCEPGSPRRRIRLR